MGPFSDSDFATTEVHEREVVLGDGKPHTLYFRELPNTDLKRYVMWQVSTDEDVRASAEARLVTVGLCSDAGGPVITLEQAVNLRLAVLKRLVNTILEVNGYSGPRLVAQGEVAGDDDEADDGLGKPSAPEQSGGSGTS